MANGTPEDNWLTWALGSVAAAFFAFIMWDKKRAAEIQDRTDAARERYIEVLSSLPEKVAAIVDRLDSLEERVRDLEREHRDQERIP